MLEERKDCCSKHYEQLVNIRSNRASEIIGQAINVMFVSSYLTAMRKPKSENSANS